MAIPPKLIPCEVVPGWMSKPDTLSGVEEVTDPRLEIASKEFREVYQVQAGDASQSAAEILATPGIPPLWSPYLGLGLTTEYAICIRRVAREINSQARLWEVSLIYTTDVAGGQYVSWTWGQEFEQVLIRKDAAGKVIQNTACERIPYEIPFAIPILTITRLQNCFSADDILNFVNCINEKPFWGAPRHCVMCAGIEDREEVVGGHKYRKVSYKFKFKLMSYEDTEGNPVFYGWDIRLLNEGSYYMVYVDADGNPYDQGEPQVPRDERCAERHRVRFTDSEGKGPAIGNLNDDGTRNDSIEYSAMSWLDFQPYKEVDFNLLDLGPWSIDTSKPPISYDPTPEEPVLCVPTPTTDPTPP